MKKIGRFIKLHGIKGEIFCQLFPSFVFPEGSLKYLSVGCDLSHQPWEVESIRPFPGGFLVKFKEINSLSEAHDLLAVEAFLPEKTIQTLQMESELIEKPFSQWIGFQVSIDGQIQGRIKEIRWYQAHPNFLISSHKGEWEYPAVDELIKEVDEEERILILEPIEGLQEL